MKTPRMIVLLTALLLLCSAAFAQDKFNSPEAGFSIDLPAEGFTVTDIPDQGLGTGKKYSWLSMDDRVFMITVYDPTFEGKPLDAKMQQAMLGGFGDGLTKSAQKKKWPITSKPYSYDGHPGKEYRIIISTGVSISRAFITPTRLYLLQATLKKRLPATEREALKTLTTFKPIEDK